MRIDKEEEMNDGQLWFRTAKKHLQAAEENLRIGQYLVAFQFAVISAEVALKSVLISKGLFIERRWPFGDKHHMIPELINKIRSENCLPNEIFQQVANIVGDDNKGGLGYIRIAEDSGYFMECTSGQHVLLRYIYKEASPYDKVKSHDAEEKVEEARQLIKIISPFF